MCGTGRLRGELQEVLRTALRLVGAATHLGSIAGTCACCRGPSTSIGVDSKEEAPWPISTATSCTLVDHIPESDVRGPQGSARVGGSSGTAILAAPLDDEPETEEERVSVASSLADASPDIRLNNSGASGHEASPVSPRPPGSGFCTFATAAKHTV